MTQESFPKRWYLELDEKRMGPFSPEQILGLLADGEIPAGLVVSPAGADAHPDSKMTASELREAYFRENRIPTAHLPADTPADTLPDAPPESHDEPGESGALDAANELATNRRLFDLFQTAKEKRAARFAPDLKAASRAGKATDSLRTPISIAAAVAVVIISGFAGLRGLRNSNDEAAGIDRELAQVAPVSKTEAIKAEAHKPEAPRPVLKNTWKPPIRSAPPVVRTVPRPAPRAPEPPRHEDQRQDDNRNEVSSANLINQMANDSGLNPGNEPPANPENAPTPPEGQDGESQNGNSSSE